MEVSNPIILLKFSLYFSNMGEYSQYKLSSSRAISKIIRNINAFFLIYKRKDINLEKDRRKM